MNFTVIGIIGILLMILMIFLGMNMGMAMFFVGFVGYAVCTNFTTAIGVLRTVPFTQASSYSLSVVPLFILMGQFAFESGISAGLYNAADKWLSKLRGGLAMANIVACGFFGAICGSSTATAVTMGVLSMPEMKKYGYDDGLSTASISAGGTLGYLIPPSTGFILYGIIAEQSIGRLFAAGIVPGIILALAYCITIAILCKRHPEYAPPAPSYDIKTKLKSLVGLLPMAALFGAVIGGMFSGLFSATEAAAVGAFLGLICMIVSKKLTFKSLMHCLLESAKTTAMVFTMIIGAYVFGYFLTVTQLPTILASWISSLNVPSILIIIMIVMLYVVLGCFMDGLATILMTVPIFMPIVSGLGYDLIWFGVLIVIVMVMGAITPPVGVNLFVVAGVAKDVPLSKIFKGSIPFCIAILAVTILCAFIPQLSLWLPNLLMGSGI